MKKPVIYTVKDILPGLFNGMSRQSAQDQSSLEGLWKETLGLEVERAVIVGFKDGCLFVNVDCAARLFQMRMRRQTILSKLQKQRADILNIVFKIGKLK